MKIYVRLGLLALSSVFTPSCGVDSRWGPPRAGLRQNMAWQYASLPAQPPVNFTTTSPQIQPAPVFTPTIPGRVMLNGKYATAPSGTPEVIQRAVSAGNALQGKPYRHGGGHAVLNDTAYDCSGTVSYVLRNSGLMSGQMPSRGFLNYGEPGEGRWITVWAKDGHVFMTIGGLRLDTGGNGGGDGPRWRDSPRSKKGFIPRHPKGL